MKHPKSNKAAPAAETYKKGDARSNWTKYGYPVLLIFSVVFIFAASQLVAFAATMTVVTILSSGMPQDIFNSVAAQFLYILLAEGLAVWSVLFFIRERAQKLGSIGLGRWPKRSDVSQAAGGFLIFFVILIALGIIFNQLSPEIVDKKQNIGFDNIKTGTEQALAFIALVIIPPIGEEILVRGYLYSGLRRVWNFMPALIVTSLLFGIAHLEFGSAAGLVWAAAIDTLVLSTVLVYLREKTGALYAGMLVHMLNNLLAFVVIIK